MPQLQSSLASVVVLVAGLFVGIVFLLVGLRGRRRGATPACRRCGYTLIGITSDRCPECGNPLTPRNIVHGRRVRRKWLALAGLLLVLGTGALLVEPAAGVWNQIDWYRIRPTRWVISDLQSNFPATADRAWRELRRREKAGSFDAADRQRLAAVALAAQAAARCNCRDELLEWLGDQVSQNTIPESQKQQFFKQFVTTDLQVRPDVALSDPVAYQASAKAQAPERGWWYRLTFVGATLDGKPLRGLGESSSSGAGSGSESTGSTIPSTQPGRHTLAVTERVEVLPGPYPSEATPVYRHDITDSATFEVSGAGARKFKETDDPSLEPLVRRNLNAHDLAVDPARKQIEGRLDVKSAPTNLAFDVFVRAGGREYPVGSFAVASGTGTSCSLFGTRFDAGAIDHADLVFRSSPAVARRTVDLFEIWKGEVVLENLPVKVRSP